MRRINRKKEFSKELIKFVVALNSILMIACIVALFMGFDVSAEFCALCGIQGGDILTYCVKAYFGKKSEEEIRIKEKEIDEDGFN